MIPPMVYRLVLILSALAAFVAILFDLIGWFWIIPAVAVPVVLVATIDLILEWRRSPGEDLGLIEQVGRWEVIQGLDGVRVRWSLPNSEGLYFHVRDYRRERFEHAEYLAEVMNAKGRLPSEFPGGITFPTQVIECGEMVMKCHSSVSYTKPEGKA